MSGRLRTSRSHSRSSSRAPSVRSVATSTSSTRAANLERLHSAQAFDDHYSEYHLEVHDALSQPSAEQLNDGRSGRSAVARQANLELQMSNDRRNSKDGSVASGEREEHEDASEKEGLESPSDGEDPEKDFEKEMGKAADSIPDMAAGVPIERDIEKGEGIDRVPSTSSSKSVKDPYLVTWDGPDDPEFPKNWSNKRRWAATFIVSCFTFISPVSSSIAAPALGQIGRDLHIHSQVELELVFSIFVLAYGFGPFFFGPASETFGRVRVLQIGNLFYLAWNLGCGFAHSSGEMIAFRFLAGIGGSTPQAVGGGVLSDCWRPEERGKAISIYALAPLLGPAIGPIAGGFISEYSTWRWAFWSTSIATVAVQVLGLFFLQETYTPVLLKRKAAKLRAETGDDRYYTEYDADEAKLWQKIFIGCKRPFRFLFTQPIIIVVASYMAYLYGLLYLIIATFPTLWTDRYHENIAIGSLNYISMALGFGIATQISARLQDTIYKRLKKRNNGVGIPEFRVPLMMVAALFVPIGIFWYGWSAQGRVQWIMPNIGMFIFSASAIIGFQCMTSYIIDSYSRYAASALAAAVFLRACAGFGFPLFATPLYNALGYGWGDSLLAFLSIGIGIPAPFVFWKYGPVLRAKSTFCAG